MKKLVYFFAAVLFFGCSQPDRPENPVLPLNYQWKFVTGDDSAYKVPNYDDSQWANIDMDKIWEQQGYDPYDGYAWFRTKIFIPSSLKENLVAALAPSRQGLPKGTRPSSAKIVRPLTFGRE